MSIDAQSYPALTSQSLGATKTIDPFSTTSSESQECYLTNTLAFFPPLYDSIMLPPHQPRLFARLARWQLFRGTVSFCLGSKVEGKMFRVEVIKFPRGEKLEPYSVFRQTRKGESPF